MNNQPINYETQIDRLQFEYERRRNNMVYYLSTAQPVNDTVREECDRLNNEAEILGLLHAMVLAQQVGKG